MNFKVEKMCMDKNDYTGFFQADEEFHKAIFEGCNKKRTWDTICQVEADFQRIRVLSLSLKLKLDDVYSQHLIIMDAIKNKKPEIADKIMKEHLTMVNFDSIKLKEKYREYFK